jgi:hypothetical protein
MHSLDSGFHSLDSGFHSLDSGFLSLDSGFRSLDSGFHYLDSGFQIGCGFRIPENWPRIRIPPMFGFWIPLHGAIVIFIAASNAAQYWTHKSSLTLDYFNKTPAQPFTLASVGKIHKMWFGLNSLKILFTATRDVATRDNWRGGCIFIYSCSHTVTTIAFKRNPSTRTRRIICPHPPPPH